jgi:hypothetical protein
MPPLAPPAYLERMVLETTIVQRSYFMRLRGNPPQQLVLEPVKNIPRMKSALW